MKVTRQQEGLAATDSPMNKPIHKLKKSLVFVGMMGCGKTTVARGLAKRFEVPFVDTDREIERSAGMKIGEIFSSQGETYFRELERVTLRQSLLFAPSSIAVGGGAYLFEENRRLIDARAISVWLKAQTDTLWHRVKDRPTRPLLQTQNPRETLIKLNDERTPLYRKARIHIDSDDTAVKSATVQKVAHALLSAAEELDIFDGH